MLIYCPHSMLVKTSYLLASVGFNKTLCKLMFTTFYRLTFSASNISFKQRKVFDRSNNMHRVTTQATHNAMALFCGKDRLLNLTYPQHKVFMFYQSCEFIKSLNQYKCK